jgi:hypothetical protein
MITVNRDQAAIAARAAADLAAFKAKAIAGINDWAGQQRLALITDLPGQDMIYLRKEAEAKAWMADPAPVLASYPLIAAELGITADTPDQIAQIWLNMADLWARAAAEIETNRLAAIQQIEAATTEAEIMAARP